MSFKKMKSFLKNYKVINFETKLFFFSSLVFFILKFIYLKANNETPSYITLLVLVTIFGLPHGALDTMLAKKFKIYYNTISFILFNLTYLAIGLVVFLFWNAFPILALYLFLLISSYHFSEDWKANTTLYERLILGFGIINLPLFFHSEEVNIIYENITNNNIVTYTKIQFYFASVNLLFLVFLAFKKIRVINLSLQISIIIIFSYALDPIYFFLSYFCFFHSMKNYKESLNYLQKENQVKINIIVFLNTLITIFFGIIFYIFFLKSFNAQNFGILIFIGLAALTVPHMILKFIISKRKVTI
jgi:beta-carotene 15,15'-dioxygenase